MKLRLRRLLLWGHMSVVCEVFNLFASCIPQDGLSRIERWRKRQGLVPDFKLPGEEGGGETLCELKCMSASVSRYPRNPRPVDGNRGVDRRAERLTENYARTVREVDRKYCGTERPPPRRRGVPQVVAEVGPVKTRLKTYGKIKGWVFGAWGEASEEVHGLVQRVALARYEILDQLPGRQGVPKSREAGLAVLVSWVRRQLSFLAVQQQSRLLLDRLQLLGDGAREAAVRWDWAVRVEAAAARDMRAQAVCLQQGRNIRRAGFGLIE